VVLRCDNTHRSAFFIIYYLLYCILW
jgi:hypothetical protein